MKNIKEIVGINEISHFAACLSATLASAALVISLFMQSRSEFEGLGTWIGSQLAASIIGVPVIWTVVYVLVGLFLYCWKFTVPFVVLLTLGIMGTNLLNHLFP